MAELLGYSTSSYSRIERNETSVEFEKLASIADILQVPIQELLPETIAITSTIDNPGPGGGVIFGNQYFYIGESEATKGMLQQLAALQAEIARFKSTDKT